MNDEQIIQLFFTRNEDAIRQTDDRYGAKLTRLSENIVGSREDAQECVNDTYFKAWDTIPPTKPVHFFAYLAKICRHLAFDRLDWNNAAKRKAEVVALTQEMEACIPAPDDMDSRIDDMMLREILNGFLGGLPEEKRNLFIRRYWYLDSIADIAERFALSESKVKTTLFRCRRQLREHLEKGGYKI